MHHSCNDICEGISRLDPQAVYPRYLLRAVCVKRFRSIKKSRDRFRQSSDVDPPLNQIAKSGPGSLDVEYPRMCSEFSEAGSIHFIVID